MSPSEESDESFYEGSEEADRTVTERVLLKQKVLHRKLTAEEFAEILREGREKAIQERAERKKRYKEEHEHGTENRLIAHDAYRLAEKCDLVLALDVISQGIRDGHEFGYNTLHALTNIMMEVGCIPEEARPVPEKTPLVNLDNDGYAKHVMLSEFERRTMKGDVYGAMYHLLLADDHGACIIKEGRKNCPETVFEDDEYQDRKWFLYDMIQANGGRLRKRRRVH